MKNDDTFKNNENNDRTSAGLTPELEVRMVAWLLGEATPAEAAELARLAEENPALAEFKRRIEVVHGLVGAAARPVSDATLRLSDERRAKVLAVIGDVRGKTTAGVTDQTPRWVQAWNQWALPMAACITLCVLLGAVMIPAVGIVRETARRKALFEAMQERLDPSSTVLGPAESAVTEMQVVNASSAVSDAPTSTASEKEYRSSDGSSFSVHTTPVAASPAPEQMNQPVSQLQRNRTLTLNGGSTYTGGTVVSGGTLQLGTENLSGSMERSKALAYSESGQLGVQHQLFAGNTRRESGDALKTVSAPVVSSSSAAVRGEIVDANGDASSSLATDGRIRRAGTGVVQLDEAGGEYQVVTGSGGAVGGASSSHNAFGIRADDQDTQVANKKEAAAGDVVAGDKVMVLGDVAVTGRLFKKNKGTSDARSGLVTEVADNGEFQTPAPTAAPSGVSVNATDAINQHEAELEASVPSSLPVVMNDSYASAEGKPRQLLAGQDRAKAQNNISVSLQRPAVYRDASRKLDALKKIALEEDSKVARKLAEPAFDESFRAETDTNQQAVSTFSLHVSDASFRLAKAALARGEAPDPASIRPEEFYNAFDYGDPSPVVGEPVSCRIEQAAHPFVQQRNLVRIAMKVPATGRGAGQPLRLTLLLDTSGSMEREDRAASVRAALTALVSLLGPDDRITLIGFARQPHLLADRVPGNQAAGLVDIVARTPFEGGTNLEEALKLAGSLARGQFTASAQNRIIVLTDGAANLGEDDPERLSKMVATLRQQGIAFDACGVGADGLDDTILEALTRKGDGRYTVINSPEEADAAFAKKLAGAFRPAAENVKVQVRFNPARVARYRLIGFEQHRLKTEDFRNDRVDAAELAAEEAAVALYQVEVIPDGEGELGEVFVRFREVATGNMVERSWTLAYVPQPPAFDRAASSMKLAGTAAFLAEKLRGGNLAAQIRLAELAPVVNTLRGDYSHDARVRNLVTMFAQARRLAGE